MPNKHKSNALHDHMAKMRTSRGLKVKKNPHYWWVPRVVSLRFFFNQIRIYFVFVSDACLMSVCTDRAFVFILMCEFSFAISCNCFANCLRLAAVSLTLSWVWVYYYFFLFPNICSCRYVFGCVCRGCGFVFVLLRVCLCCCMCYLFVFVFRYFAFPVCVCCLRFCHFFLILFWQNKDTHSPNAHSNSLALNHTRPYHIQIGPAPRHYNQLRPTRTRSGQLRPVSPDR